MTATDVADPDAIYLRILSDVRGFRRAVLQTAQVVEDLCVALREFFGLPTPDRRRYRPSTVEEHFADLDFDHWLRTVELDDALIVR